MMVAERRRLDQALVERGLAASRERAQVMVRAGLVRVGGTMTERPDQMVAADQAIELTGARDYVSRGGEKLAAALDYPPENAGELMEEVQIDGSTTPG